jgi:hypothetical protein
VVTVVMVVNPTQRLLQLRRQKKIEGFWPKVTMFLLKIDVLVENGTVPDFGLRNTFLFVAPFCASHDVRWESLTKLSGEFRFVRVCALHENSHRFE